MPTNKYTIQTLYDGLTVVKKLMENLSPFFAYSIADLIKIFPEFDYQKMYRIMVTLTQAGFTEERDNRYTLGTDLYLLSHRYFKALEKEHGKIKDKINQFSL